MLGRFGHYSVVFSRNANVSEATFLAVWNGEDCEAKKALKEKYGPNNLRPIEASLEAECQGYFYVPPKVVDELQRKLDLHYAHMPLMQRLMEKE